MTHLIKLAVLLVIAANTTFATPQTAFERIKSLEGKWAIQSNGKALTTQMSYEVGSKGSIVTEQFGKELSVFYSDGQSLLMTHFCNGGNQPRLRLKENSQPGLLEFEMFDITNLKDPTAAHVQRIIYRIVDERTMDLEIVWRQDKSEDSEKYRLTKI